MTKSRVLALAALLCLTTASFASPARMGGMGLDAEAEDSTQWMIGSDDTLIALNPAQLSFARPMVWGRAKQQPQVYGCGVVFGFGPGTNLLVTTGAPYALAGFGGTGFAALPPLTQEQFNAAFAFPLDKARLGFAASFTHVFSDRTEAPVAKNSVLVGSFAAGAFVDLAKGSSAEGSVKVAYHALESEAAGVKAYSASVFDVGAYGRFNAEIAPGNALRATARYAFKDRTYEQALTGKNTVARHLATLGLADELRLSEKTLVFAGLQGFLRQDQNEADGDSRLLQVQLAGGMESAFSDFLTFRIGAERAMFNLVEDATARTATNLESATDLSMGVGILIGELLFDLDLNIRLLSSGPDFISGVAPGPWSADLVATYYLDAKAPKAPAPKK